MDGFYLSFPRKGPFCPKRSKKRLKGDKSSLIWKVTLPNRSNPVLTSGFDLFAVAPDSTLPRFFVNSAPVVSCQLGFLNMFPLSLNCSFQIIKSGVPVN